MECWPVVTGTGHRPQGMLPPQRDWLLERIPAAVDWLVEQRGMRTGVSGMALGFDTWWAQALLRRRDQRGDVTLHACVPCPDQAARWRTKDRAVWRGILARADVVEYVSDHYHDTVMDDRNERMLGYADGVLAALNPYRRSSGTGRAVASANRRGLPGVLLDLHHRSTRLVASGGWTEPAPSAQAL